MSASAFDALRSDIPAPEVVIPKNMQQTLDEEDKELNHIIEEGRFTSQQRVRRASMQKSATVPAASSATGATASSATAAAASRVGSPGRYDPSERRPSTPADKLRMTAHFASAVDIPGSPSAIRAKQAGTPMNELNGNGTGNNTGAGSNGNDVGSVIGTGIARRFITATGLHRALEILKIAKHRSHEESRKDARVSYSYDLKSSWFAGLRH
jgi:hypothetical protein